MHFVKFLSESLGKEIKRGKSSIFYLKERRTGKKRKSEQSRKEKEGKSWLNSQSEGENEKQKWNGGRKNKLREG